MMPTAMPGAPALARSVTPTGIRKAAASVAATRPPRRANDNTRSNAPGARPSGYNGRPNEPGPGPGEAYNAAPNRRQPPPERGGDNERSNPPSSMPPNTAERGNAPTPTTRAPRGGQRTAPTSPQPEPTPAQIAQPIGGDRFARATARARARLRGGVTS